MNTAFSNTRKDRYRFTFQGQEKDDEVKGNGNAYTTPFRQYDPRLGRWLSIDPLVSKFPNQGPYNAYNNNPIYWVDPTGKGGEVTADKKEKTITVNQKILFWKNKEDGTNTQVSNQEGLVADLQDSDQGGWNSSFNVDMSEEQDGSDMWTVTYNTEFVPIEAGNQGQYERIAKKMQKREPTTDYLNVINAPGQASNYFNGVITINVGAPSRPLVETFGHEKGHTLGLREASSYQQFGLSNNRANPNYNGSQNPTGQIMSYAVQRSTQIAEVRLQVQTYYSLIQDTEDQQTVRIGFFGPGNRGAPFKRK